MPLKTEPIYLALAFNSIERVVLTLEDTMDEIKRDRGPYWFCAKGLVERWEAVIKTIRDHLKVKKAFGGDVNAGAVSLCGELEKVLQEIHHLFVVELRPEASGGVNETRYRHMSRYKAAALPERDLGKQVLTKCERLCATFRALQSRATQQLPSYLLQP